MDEAYEVEFTDVALKHLRRLPRNLQARILRQIELLAQNPATKSNVKRLVNYGTAYHLRVGDHPVLYDQDDVIRVIDVIDIRHRRDAYRR